MYYVYIIESQKDKSYYKGVTNKLRERLKEHNQDGTRYSSAKRPFKMVWYCAFTNKEKAYKFERYLKSGSGFAFAKKHLI